MALVVVMNGTEYQLAATLRVAYKIQGLNNHKAYTEIFSEVSRMPIEKQIEVIYVAFSIANPDLAKTVSFNVFLDYCLDNFDVGQIMEMLTSVINGILGKDLIEKAVQAEQSNGGQGNA